ncbi:MAG: shikimate dehydrogenase [Lachnospiraceae bacterium]|nr:shikimate dehydrogenase [Lachnospiraceae bacterium]
MRKYCVIGYPVGHSRSPQLFERFSTERGLVYGTDVIYERNEIENKEELLRFVDELKTGIWSGCNVTMPWKTEMMQYMDDISDIARITDAVNTISSRRGKLYGDSTDGRGMLNPLKDVLGKERIGAMVILGCGGAARSIIAEALLRNTGKVNIVCRGINEDMSSGSGQNEENSPKPPSNLELTLKMLSRIKSGNTETVFVDSDDHEGIQAAIDEAEVLINSTPLGMADGHGNENRLPISESIVFDKRLIVADCVYNPDETLLIKKALSSGCRTIKGIKMLEEQARCGVDFLLGRY